MREALVTMCKRIDSFTENPAFKLLDVVDAEQSLKATRDLRDIVRLSADIVKLAEKLKTRRLANRSIYATSICLSQAVRGEKEA
jgi:hypothetical protein